MHKSESPVAVPHSIVYVSLASESPAPILLTLIESPNLTIVGLIVIAVIEGSIFNIVCESEVVFTLIPSTSVNSIIVVTEVNGV